MNFKKETPKLTFNNPKYWGIPRILNQQHGCGVAPKISK